MNHAEIAKKIIDNDKKIILIYAFNTTGKTRISVEFKNQTKNLNHTGVYYNAFSEDLFVWDNDIPNGEEDIKFLINNSSLNQFHTLLTEDAIRGKLKPYKINYSFSFNLYENPENGIESISFFILKKNKENEEDERVDIKISRGEERIFVWCFYLALFEVEGLSDNQNNHFFIDDPVSSLDDHNIFITAMTLMNLIEKYSDKRKIVITTHHVGFFSILSNWLTKGEKSESYKKITDSFILNKEKTGSLALDSPKKSVFLYHLHLLRVLNEAKENKKLVAYHFVLVRQVLENLASFLGVGQFGYVLEQIGFEKKEKIPELINILSHKDIYTYESEVIGKDNKNLIIDILNKLQAKYKFVLHV